MSVTIIEVPSQYTPAYNQQAYVVSGTNYPSGNYKLIAKVKNLASTVLAKLKVPTNPTYPKVGVFDIHRVVENYVSHTIDIGIDRPTIATNNIFGFTVEFGEEYGTPPTEHYSSDETGTQYIINTALSPKEFLGWDYTDFLQNLSGTWDGRLLCKYRGSRKVFRTSKAFLYAINDASHYYSAVTYMPYDSAGNAINALGYTVSIPFTGDAAGQVIYIPAGVANINAIPQSQIISGTSGQLIPASAAYYDIYLNRYTGAVTSESLRFTIVDAGCKYTNYPIYFLGQYGNVELWNFDKRSDKRSTIKRDMYKSALGGLITETHYGYTASDRQETQYNTEVQDTVTLNTDNLTEAELAFLKELVQSPQVWHYDGTNLIPVIVTDSQYEEKQKANDKVFNLTINISYASTTELQRY
mgnify:FL=1